MLNGQRYTNGNEVITFVKKFNKAIGSALVEHYQFERTNGTKFEIPKGEFEKNWEISNPHK